MTNRLQSFVAENKRKGGCASKDQTDTLFHIVSHSRSSKLAGGVLLLLLPLLSAAQVRPLQQRLDDEIGKMLSAGHLRPAYYNNNEKWFFRMIQNFQYVTPTQHEFWSNPAETIYTLIRALPHVSDRPALAQYIQDEWTLCPPYQYTHCGWSGARREHFEMVTGDREAAYYYGTSAHALPGVYDSWSGFSFNPFNIYACWLYAQEFGNAINILNRVRNKIQTVPEPFADTRPNLLNAYLAGYVGYLELQALAGETPRADVQSWLDRAIQLRVAAEAIPLVEQPGIEFGGWLYLVPEVADLLRPLLPEAETRLDEYTNVAVPYWFAAKIDEVNRLAPNRDIVLEEGASSVYYSYASPFQAKALLLREPRSELERWLDVPGVWRGDLYYIQNLVAVIEASDAGVPGDVDGDGVLTPTDLELLISQILGISPVTGPGDLNKDGAWDVTDAQSLVNLLISAGVT